MHNFTHAFDTSVRAFHEANMKFRNNSKNYINLNHWKTPLSFFRKPYLFVIRHV